MGGDFTTASIKHVTKMINLSKYIYKGLKTGRKIWGLIHFHQFPLEPVYSESKSKSYQEH